LASQINTLLRDRNSVGNGYPTAYDFPVAELHTRELRHVEVRMDDPYQYGIDERTARDFGRRAYSEPWRQFSRHSENYELGRFGRLGRRLKFSKLGQLIGSRSQSRSLPLPSYPAPTDVPSFERLRRPAPQDYEGAAGAVGAAGAAGYQNASVYQDSPVYRRTQDYRAVGGQAARAQAVGARGFAREIPPAYGAGNNVVAPQEKPARKHKRAHVPHPHRPRHVVRTTLLTLLALIVISYLVFCVPIDRKVAFSATESSSLSEVLSPSIPGLPSYTLLLGSDAREGDTVSRTDTIILARTDTISNTVTLVSIPRDTMVDLGEYGTQKINAAYAYGGAALSVSAVEELCGVDISHVVVIDFDGLATLVDAIGGVTVTVPVDINDPDYTGLVLSAGTYDMDGATALAFARVRHGFALGDYQRQEDQRILIEAILDKILDSPLLIPAATSALGDVVTTNYHCYSVFPLLARMAIGSPTIYSASIPSTTATIDGVSYVVADESALTTMMQVVDEGGDPSTVANGLE
jgi:LCP family protein required for cell wall assembly